MAQFGEELAFLKTQALSLRSIPVTFPNDYQPALQDVPRKVAVFAVALPPPPRPSSSKTQPTTPASTGGAGIPIIIKSTKPALTFDLTVHPTDTISDIKSKLAQKHLRAPPPNSQRLLLKGKVLADTKLLKEYTISDNTTITLMTKPGTTWTGEEREAESTGPAEGIVSAEPETFAAPAPTLPPPATASRHGRSLSGQADSMPLPSLTLSPTPSANESSSKDVKLELATDLDLQPDPVRVKTPTAEAFASVISDPEFWQKMLTFLEGEFKTADDARSAWEEFFLSSKTHLTAHQIAKIRDVTGVVAMAGY